jgi:eukaryotic-like serine/threonine-protein kinase
VMGAIQLNASPFAEVVRITSADGKDFALPDGDHWTPLRIDRIPAGHYTVTFKGADGATQTQPCDVADSAPACTIEIKPIDDATIEQLVGGSK